MIAIIGVLLITSWALPVVGIFIFDSTTIKVFFGVLLLINIFVGGSAKGASMMARERAMSGNRWLGWEATNVIVKSIIATICITTFFLFDDAKPIDGIYTENELQRAYIEEKQAYDAENLSYTQTIIGTALAKDSTSKKMWKDAVKKRKSLRGEWERRKRDFDATRASLR
jgi:hypothetical protein